jgi:hypothetical protein
MPAVFANPYASRSQHISSQKIAQLRLKEKMYCGSLLIGSLFEFAKSNLEKAGYNDIVFIKEDGALGYREMSPY